MNRVDHHGAPTDVECHSLRKSLILHLLPGALATTGYLLLAPLGQSLGLPSFLMLMVAAILLALPLELGYMFWEARNRNCIFSLRGIIVFREPLSTRQYVLLAVPLLIWMFLVAALINPPIESAILESIFAWVPDIYFITSFAENVSDYSRSTLIVSALLLILINGIAGPIVEELYFRGYLMPRLSHLGRWAPLVNTVLFSLYHFFSPWQNPLRILAFTPVYYIVWWKRNIYIGIIVHCLGNLIGSVGLLILILQTAPVGP